MGKKKGRPAKAGERYACGKLKPTGDPISGAAWQRIRADAVKVVRDERLASEVGRLSFHKEISDAQAAAAFRVGAIYGLFDRDHHGKPRFARSPSYELGFSGSVGATEELIDAEILRDRVRRERATLEAFTALQDEFALWEFNRDRLSVRPEKALEHHGATRRTPRLLVEAVCVDDRTIAPHELPVLSWALDRLVSFFGSSQSRKKKKRKAKGKYVAHAVAGGHKERSPEEIDRSVQEKFIRALRPDLADGDVAKALTIHTALRDRERFNERKTRDKRLIRESS